MNFGGSLFQIIDISCFFQIRRLHFYVDEDALVYQFEDLSQRWYHESSLCSPNLFQSHIEYIVFSEFARVAPVKHYQLFVFGEPDLYREVSQIE